MAEESSFHFQRLNKQLIWLSCFIIVTIYTFFFLVPNKWFLITSSYCSTECNTRKARYKNNNKIKTRSTDMTVIEDNTPRQAQSNMYIGRTTAMESLACTPFPRCLLEVASKTVLPLHWHVHKERDWLIFSQPSAAIGRMWNQSGNLLDWKERSFPAA